MGDDGRPAQDEAAQDAQAQAQAQAPAPETASDPDVLHRVLARLDDLDRRLGAEQERAQAREEVIAHQRAELDALRDERRGRHLRPLVVGLAKLRAELLEDADHAAGDHAAADDPAAGRRRDTLTYYAESVASVLEGCGCEPVTVAVGDVFDAAAHRVRRPVATGPESHGRVVAVLSEGWLERDSGRVLAPAGVAVGRHEPAQNTQSAGNTHDQEAAPHV